MKRSQMIEKLFDLIRTTPLRTVEEDKICAEKVLDLVEELGMKPPLTERCPVLLTNKHVWEKEDAQTR